MSRLKNFIWQREDEPQNALAYVFLYVNTIYALAFMFFPNSLVVATSAFGESILPPEIWGLLTLLLVIGTLYTIATRTKFLGELMGFLGVGVWGYGLALNLIFGMSYFGILVIYIPQIIFWGFWYIGVRRFYRREEQT